MSNGELWKALAGYNGPQLFVALAIVLIIALSVFARFYLAPGTAILAAKVKDRDDAVGILKNQLAQIQKEKDELEEENKRLNHKNRQLETANAGFAWVKTNPKALRILADDIEKNQAKQANALPQSSPTNQLPDGHAGEKTPGLAET